MKWENIFQSIILNLHKYSIFIVNIVGEPHITKTFKLKEEKYYRYIYGKSYRRTCFKKSKER